MTASVPIALPEDLSKKKYYGYNFSGMDLSRRRLRQSIFLKCNFDNANLAEADCTGSDFTGSSFMGTNCYRTNFADAKLGATLFEPKDCFGMTVTLQCSTFQNMRVSPLWFFAWLIFGTMMIPVTNEPIKDNLIAAIGAERYVKLKSLFSKREI